MVSRMQIIQRIFLLVGWHAFLAVPLTVQCSPGILTSWPLMRKLSLKCRLTSSYFFSFITSSKDMLNRVQDERHDFLGPHSANHLVICPSTTTVYSVSLQSDSMTSAIVKSRQIAIILLNKNSMICLGIWWDDMLRFMVFYLRFWS